jgi:hypothetical protein
VLDLFTINTKKNQNQYPAHYKKQKEGSIIDRLTNINRMRLPYQFMLYKTIAVACAQVLSLFLISFKKNIK